MRTVSGLNLLANSVILKCKLWEPLLPPEGQNSRRPAKLLQMMQLHQALPSTASQQQGTLPSMPSGVESKR